MYIIAFDIGIKNLAWALLKKINNNFDNIEKSFIVENFNLYNPFDILMSNVYLNIHEYLNKNHHIWNKADIILIEQQMSTKFVNNIKAIKISQHIYAFFLIHYPNKKIIEFKPVYKTKLFNVQFNNKKDRKLWSIHKVKDLFKDDPVFLDLLSCFSKQDDICDCILMCIVYFFK
jgi:virulence-associated protein VapD